MTIERKHWLTAFLFALLAHGAFVLVLWKPAESGAANLGVGGINISFGTAGGAPGAAEVSAPETKTVEPTETKVETPPETIPDDPVETVEVTEPLEIEAVEPPTAETVPVAEVKPKTETAKLPKKIEPPKLPKIVEPKPAPEAEPPKEIAEKEPEPAKPTQKASIAGSAGKSGITTDRQRWQAATAPQAVVAPVHRTIILPCCKHGWRDTRNIRLLHGKGEMRERRCSPLPSAVTGTSAMPTLSKAVDRHCSTGKSCR